MRALGMRRIVGVTYFTGAINDVFARYFTEAGFDVMAMAGIDVPFDGVGHLRPRDVFDHAVRACRAASGADGIYLLGSGWRVLGIVEDLERECAVPVLHPVPARVWAVQSRLGVHETRTGYGRLLATLPAPVTAAAAR